MLKNGPTLGASHQAWQLARVNELVWPSPGRIGVVDKTLWDQTVSVATSQNVVAAAPDADAYSNTHVQKAVDALKAGGMDVTGSSYKAPQVTLKEGGKKGWARPSPTTGTAGPGCLSGGGIAAP